MSLLLQVVPGPARRRQPGAPAAASAGRVAVPPVLPICAQMPRAGGAPEPARGSGEQCGSKPWRAAGFSGGARTRKASAAALVALGLVAAGRADAGPDNGSSGGSHHSDGPGGSGGGGSFYGMYGLSAGEIVSQGSPSPPSPLPPPSSPLPNPGTGPTPARAGLSGIARKSLVAGCSKSEESCARWDP